MAVKIKAQATVYHGGVLILVGFLHRKLVSLLNDSQVNTRFALFTNSANDITPQSNMGWLQLSDQKFRQEFYGVETQHFDLSKRPSFQMISAVSRLTEIKTCHKPQVGHYLSEAVGGNCEFEIDNELVVTAVVKPKSDQYNKTISTIETSFPGLHFFCQKRHGERILRVPGINLPENKEVLSEGFRSLNIMK